MSHARGAVRPTRTPKALFGPATLCALCVLALFSIGRGLDAFVLVSPAWLALWPLWVLIASGGVFWFAVVPILLHLPRGPAGPVVVLLVFVLLFPLLTLMAFFALRDGPPTVSLLLSGPVEKREMEIGWTAARGPWDTERRRGRRNLLPPVEYMVWRAIRGPIRPVEVSHHSRGRFLENDAIFVPRRTGIAVSGHASAFAPFSGESLRLEGRGNGLAFWVSDAMLLRDGAPVLAPAPTVERLVLDGR